MIYYFVRCHWFIRPNCTFDWFDHQNFDQMLIQQIMICFKTAVRLTFKYYIAYHIMVGNSRQGLTTQMRMRGSRWNSEQVRNVYAVCENNWPALTVRNVWNVSALLRFNCYMPIQLVHIFEIESLVFTIRKRQQVIIFVWIEDIKRINRNFSTLSLSLSGHLCAQIWRSSMESYIAKSMENGTIS